MKYQVLPLFGLLWALLPACTGEVGPGGMAGLVDRSRLLPPSERFTTDVQLADLDEDGDLDIIWANQIPTEGWDAAPGLVIHMNRGDGHFDAVEETVTDSWAFIRGADLDGDEDIDLVLSRPAETSDEVMVLSNDGTGALRPAAGAVPPISGTNDGLVYARVAAGDVDGDGDADLLVPTFSSMDNTTGRPDILLLNDGTGSFTRDAEGRLPTVAPEDDYTLGVLASDFDGDGDIDLFAGEAEHRPRLFVNDGTGHFSDQTADDGTGTARLPEQLLRAYNVDAGDLDGDGDLDIVVVNDASVTTGAPVVLGNQLLRNGGDGHFQIEELPLTDEQHDSRGLACGDINADGISDVVLGNATETITHEGTAIEVLLGKADGGFEPVTRVPHFSVGVFGIAIGDLNGDGRDDVVGAVNEPSPTGDLSNIMLFSE